MKPKESLTQTELSTIRLRFGFGRREKLSDLLGGHSRVELDEAETSALRKLRYQTEGLWELLGGTSVHN